MLRTYRASGRRCPTDLDLDRATFESLRARAGSPDQERTFERWISGAARVCVDDATGLAATSWESTEVRAATPNAVTVCVRREDTPTFGVVGSCVSRELVRQIVCGTAVFEEIRSPATGVVRVAYVVGDDVPGWFVE